MWNRGVTRKKRYPAIVRMPFPMVKAVEQNDVRNAVRKCDASKRAGVIEVNAIPTLRWENVEANAVEWFRIASGTGHRQNPCIPVRQWPSYRFPPLARFAIGLALACALITSSEFSAA